MTVVDAELLEVAELLVLALELAIAELLERAELLAVALELALPLVDPPLEPAPALEFVPPVDPELPEPAPELPVEAVLPTPPLEFEPPAVPEASPLLDPVVLAPPQGAVLSLLPQAQRVAIAAATGKTIRGRIWGDLPSPRAVTDPPFSLSQN